MNNVYKGFSEENFSHTGGWKKGNKPFGINKKELLKILPYTQIEGIGLDFIEILSTPLDVKPLKRHNIGPSWCKTYPGSYFETGIFENNNK